MTYLLIENGIIVNAIAWDGTSPYTPPDGTTLVSTDQPYNIGWAWDGTAPVEPPAEGE